MPRERRRPVRFKDSGDSDQDSTSSDKRSTGSSQPNSPTKRRRGSANPQQSPSSSIPELVPPPLTARADTIVAQNPFDDQPPTNIQPPSNIQQTPSNNQPPTSTPSQQHEHGMMNKMPAQHGPPVSHGSQRVYPPNQSMVFNSSNPNAPPIYPCGICHKEVHDNDQAILCESGCNFWFHRVCTGLTEAAYHMLTQEVYAEWVCNDCLTTKKIPLVKMKP